MITDPAPLRKVRSHDFIRFPLSNRRILILHFIPDIVNRWGGVFMKKLFDEPGRGEPLYLYRSVYANPSLYGL